MYQRIMRFGEEGFNVVAFVFFVILFLVFILIGFLFFMPLRMHRWVCKELGIWRTPYQCPNCLLCTLEYTRSPFLVLGGVRRWRGDCYKCGHVEIKKF